MLILISQSLCFSQINKQFRLYAILGAKNNKFNNKFGTNSYPEFYPFTLGAGSSIHFNKLQLGTEFYNTSSTRSFGGNKFQYSSFSSNLYVGYNILKTSKMYIEPALGLNVNHNQLLLFNNSNSSQTDLNNNQFGIHSSITFLIKNNNGVCQGIKFSYNYCLVGATNWKYISSKSDSPFKDNVSYFSLQFITGGILNLYKKNDSSLSTK